MSYSISAKGKTKRDLTNNIVDNFDLNVIKHQPIHHKDKKTVIDAAESAVALLPSESEHGYVASLNGSISTVNDEVQSVSFSIYAAIATSSLEDK